MDVSTVAEVYEEEGVLKTKGLTGRILKINKEWKNRDGKWYIGVKRGYEIFPDSLITRLKKVNNNKRGGREYKMIDE